MQICKDSHTQVTANFSSQELYSQSYNAPDCHYLNDNVINALQYLRLRYNCPVKVTSTFRTSAANSAAGGAKSSKHLTGNAIDFAFTKKSILRQAQKDMQGDELKNILAQFGVNGLGLYDNFIHIDYRTSPALWDNRTSSGLLASISASLNNNEDGLLDWIKPLTSILIVIIITTTLIIYKT